MAPDPQSFQYKPSDETRIAAAELSEMTLGQLGLKRDITFDGVTVGPGDTIARYLEEYLERHEMGTIISEASESESDAQKKQRLDTLRDLMMANSTEAKKQPEYIALLPQRTLPKIQQAFVKLATGESMPITEKITLISQYTRAAKHLRYLMEALEEQIVFDKDLRGVVKRVMDEDLVDPHNQNSPQTKNGQENENIIQGNQLLDRRAEINTLGTLCIKIKNLTESLLPPNMRRL